MGVILRNEFTVAGDLETVWGLMLDLESVAGCVPGARIEAVSPPNSYQGSIRVRIGPMTVDYKGQATLAEVDEERRTATILLKARETKGQGAAVATVRNRLEATPGGTRVVAETELQITGPQAMFGKGVLEDVGSRVLQEFSRRLEERMATDAGGSTSAAGAGEVPRADYGSGADGDTLDLGRVVVWEMFERSGKVVGVVVVLGLAIVLGRCCRRRGGARS